MVIELKKIQALQNGGGVISACRLGEGMPLGVLERHNWAISHHVERRMSGGLLELLSLEGWQHGDRGQRDSRARPGETEWYWTGGGRWKW